MKTCKKPIFPILPSIINVKEEIHDFIHNKNRINFPEESVFGKALAKIINTPKPQPLNPTLPSVDTKAIRGVIDNCENGYLSLRDIGILLDAAGIERKKEIEVTTLEDAVKYARKMGYPLVMKVVGPLHKSDVGGVVLNITDEETVINEFNRLIKIKDTYAVEICPMLFGTEVFIGAAKEENFGHQILFGLGGVFVEVMKDVHTTLAPVNKEEAKSLIYKLKGYKILEGIRGNEPVNIDKFAELVARISALVMAAPEIAEMDLNPLLATSKAIVAVDARIRVEK
jgi:acetyltransferase